MNTDTESVKRIVNRLRHIVENVRIERVKDLTHDAKTDSTGFDETENLYVNNNADEQLLLIQNKPSEIHDKCKNLLYQINSISIMQEKAFTVLESNRMRHKMFYEQMEFSRQAYDAFKSDVAKRNTNKTMQDECASGKLKELTEKRDKLNEKLAFIRKTMRENSSRLTEVNKQIFQQNQENKTLLKNLHSQLKNLEAQRKDAATKLEQLKKTETNV